MLGRLKVLAAVCVCVTSLVPTAVAAGAMGIDFGGTIDDSVVTVWVRNILPNRIESVRCCADADGRLLEFDSTYDLEPQDRCRFETRLPDPSQADEVVAQVTVLYIQNDETHRVEFTIYPSVRMRSVPAAERSPITYLIITVLMLGLILFLGNSASTDPASYRIQILMAWATDLFAISFWYSVAFCGPALHTFLLESSIPLLPQVFCAPIRSALSTTSLENWLTLGGQNYGHFWKQLSIPLFVYVGTVHLLVVWTTFRFRGPRHDDTAIAWWLVAKLGLDRSRMRSGRKFPRTKILSYFVKAFYIPLLTSWALGDILYEIELLQTFELDYHHVHRLLLATLILIDISIFSAGYLVESPFLKNQIRSVDPTLLGWVSCLACYPPFNSIVFPWIPSVSWNHHVPEYTVTWYMLSLLTLFLWGIYVWATIALGWKASNLTHRGIVDHGPYRWVRHPAYVSKLAVWTIATLLVPEESISLVLVLAVVYGIRAWTEERHLSADRCYLEYKSRVSWRFIPGLL